MRRGGGWGLFAVAVAVASVLLPAMVASASYDPIASGIATLTLDPVFKKMLKREGIALSGRKTAKAKPGPASLRVVGGKADPTIRKAEIEAGGELVLRSERGSVALTHISLFTKATPLIAKVGGGQLKVAKAASVSLDRDGFGNRLRATGLKLTAKAATRFNKRLRTDAFHQGMALGKLTASTQPTTVAVLPTGIATIGFDPTIYAKLKALSTSVTPIFPAEHVGPTYTFPIAAEGRVAPDLSSGTLKTSGALEFLRLGAGQIFWRELWLDFFSYPKPPFELPGFDADVDLEPVPPFLGAIGRTGTLDLRSFGSSGEASADPAARTISVVGATLILTSEAAAHFNAAFAEGKPEFAPGDLLGTLSVTAQTQ